MIFMKEIHDSLKRITEQMEQSNMQLSIPAEIYTSAFDSIAKSATVGVQAALNLQMEYLRSMLNANLEIQKPIQILQDYCLYNVTNSINSSLEKLNNSISLIALALNHITNDLMVSVSDKTISSFQQFHEYVPNDQKPEFEEIVSIKPDQSERKLSGENIRFLVGLIFPIVASIAINYLPDSYEAKIEKQNEILIEQNQQIIDLLQDIKQNTACRDELIESVVEAINSLNEDIGVSEDTVNTSGQSKNSIAHDNNQPS